MPHDKRGAEYCTAALMRRSTRLNDTVVLAVLGRFIFKLCGKMMKKKRRRHH